MAKRKLTENEIEMAKSVFGNAIDYDAVRVSHKKYSVFQSKNVGMAPDGNIYMLGKLKSDDYGLEENVYLRSLFIHEMTHVWQHQNKILNPLHAGARLMVRHKFNYQAAYPYKLDLKKDLLDYNMEQQASIVQDYFMLQNQGIFRWNGRCKNTLKNPEKIASYEKVLKRFLADPNYARKGVLKAKKPPDLHP